MKKRLLFIITYTLLSLKLAEAELPRTLAFTNSRFYLGLGEETVSSLDGTAVNLLGGMTASMEEMDESMIFEAQAAISVIPASENATPVDAAYEVTIFNIGMYSGYLLGNEDSSVRFMPKAGLNLAYASSTQSYAISLAAGARVIYELKGEDMQIFADYTIIKGAKMLSFGVSFPFVMD